MDSADEVPMAALSKLSCFRGTGKIFERSTASRCHPATRTPVIMESWMGVVRPAIAARLRLFFVSNIRCAFPVPETRMHGFATCSSHPFPCHPFPCHPFPCRACTRVSRHEKGATAFLSDAHDALTVRRESVYRGPQAAFFPYYDNHRCAICSFHPCLATKFPRVSTPSAPTRQNFPWM